MGQLLNAVKLAIRQANEANPPAAVMFGVVVSPAPLSVLVDNRFTVSGEMLIPLRGFVAGEFPATHIHKIDPHKHGTPAGDSEEIELITNEETETYLGLAAGDKVVLLRDHGGGRFVILGRA